MSIKNERTKAANESMAKDVLVFQKDLAQVIQEIGKKNKEVESLSSLISSLREEYKELSTKKEPLLKGLEKRISELRENKISLEKEIAGLFQNKTELMSRRNAIVKDTQRYEAQKQAEKVMLEQELQELENIKKSIKGNIRTESDFLEKIKEKVNAKLGVEEEVKKLGEKRQSLLLEVGSFQSRKEEFENMLKEIKDYREHLEKWERQLIHQAQQIKLMQNRIKPKYIKIFKSYANVD